MPGQTGVGFFLRGARRRPSMEGRTIARPDHIFHQYPSSARYPFNGGPDNCPARLRHALASLMVRPDPSMEGRTIARPDARPDGPASIRHSTFNGGPDNCPARRGRAPSPSRRRVCPFNGGPDNCPARLRGNRPDERLKIVLQWRAGQLPGQTLTRPCDSRSMTRPSMEGRTIARPDGSDVVPLQAGDQPFNGGPDNCPARHQSHQRPAGAGRTPSMEGRTIARPDRPARRLIAHPHVMIL